MSRFTLALALAASAAGAPATPPPAFPSPPPAKSGLPDEFELQKVPFAKPAMGETFARVDAAARKVAGKDWQTRAGDRYPYSFSNGGSDGYNQTYAATWAQTAVPERGPPPRPNHTVYLHTTVYAHKPPAAYGFKLRADRRPKSGWGASVEYSTHDGKNGVFEWFSLSLWHDELRPAPATEPWLGLYLGSGRTQFSASRSDDHHIYRFLVTAAPGQLPRDRAPFVAEVAKYWTSAESLRDTALAELDALEANAKDGITSGKAFQVTTKGGPTGADVPMPVPKARVPDEIKAAVLKEALAEIANRKKLVREHFKEMHAAATAAFPGLDDALTPKK